RVPAEERAVQESRGADERARHRREELPETEAAAHHRHAEGRARSAESVGVPPGRRRGRAPRMARVASSNGYSLLEVVFVAGLGTTLTAMAVPQMLTTLDEERTAGAARYIAARLQQTRMEALARSAAVALQFTVDGTSYSYAAYVDGNDNGVLAR